MPILLSLGLLIVLFLVLGLSADQVAKNLRVIAVKLGLPIFLLGLVLGLLTSSPEISLAVNAMIDDVQGLSIGNLMGGTVVLLSLILGVGVILNKEIKNDGRLSYLAFSFAYLVLPLVLALKGNLNFVDGIILTVTYLVLMASLYYANHQLFNLKLALVNEARAVRETLVVIAGIILIMISSHFIVQITEGLLRQYALSPFLIGLIFFPLGTNLPELTVAIASWRRKDKELSFSNLLGSAAANSLMIGILVTIRTYQVSQAYNYAVTLITLLLLTSLLLIFYRSGRKLARPEGIVLIAFYILFMIFQFLSDPLHL